MDDAAGDGHFRGKKRERARLCVTNEARRASVARAMTRVRRAQALARPAVVVVVAEALRPQSILFFSFIRKNDGEREATERAVCSALARVCGTE